MLSHNGLCQADTAKEQLLALKYAPRPFCGNMIELRSLFATSLIDPAILLLCCL